MKTVQILKKKRSKQLEISIKAVKRSKDFKPALFTARFKYFVARGIESHVFHRFVETAIPIVRSLTSSQFYGGLSDDIRDIYAAAIVEPNIHAIFEFVVRTIVRTRLIFRLSYFLSVRFTNKCIPFFFKDLQAREIMANIYIPFAIQ